jgi:hypothetical protein
VERKRKTVEVLATDGTAVTKARMKYIEYAKQIRTAGKDKTTGGPVVGKTYVLELKNGQVAVSGASAVLALDGERTIVLKSHESFAVRLSAAGPRVVDVEGALRQAAAKGLFWEL